MKRHILWHYTDVAGMIGIVETDSLRLGDAAFLNDRTEREYSLNLARDVLLAPAKRYRKKDGLRELMAEYLTPDVWYTSLYVCSLSETAESISQWQRYGAEGYGYCIGFDSSALIARYRKAGVELRRMIYQPDEQRNLISEHIRHLIERLKSDDAGELEFLRNKDNDEIAPHLSVRLTEATSELKNPQFEDEREWRLICETLNDEAPQYDWESPNWQCAGRT